MCRIKFLHDQPGCQIYVKRDGKLKLYTVGVDQEIQFIIHNHDQYRLCSLTGCNLCNLDSSIKSDKSPGLDCTKFIQPVFEYHVGQPKCPIKL